MRLLSVVALVAAMVLGTLFGGWYAIPIASAAWAGITRYRGAHWQAGVAALVAWGGLMALLSFQPSFGTLLAHLGKLFPVPGVAVVVIALLLAFVLATAAARVVLGIVGVKTHTA